MCAEPRPPKGAFIVSLDFELHWGVRESVGRDHPYIAAILGAREAVPRMLDLFAEFGIAATWATVGFLFARSRAEREELSPRMRPTYTDMRLDGYAEVTGESEADDPLHFGWTLIQRIHDTPRQEIATHTFSHYYCQEPGQGIQAFAADLDSAISIARRRGIELRSIVLPSNQHNPAYDEILLDRGIGCYRGNGSSWTMADCSAAGEHFPRRAIRLLDSYLPLTGARTVDWDDIVQPNGLCDVAASMFFRPWTPRTHFLQPLRLRRIMSGMTAAAQTGTIFHLWWHPHNFGLHVEHNLVALRRVLEHYRTLHKQFELHSLSMTEAAEQARVLANAAA